LKNLKKQHLGVLLGAVVLLAALGFIAYRWRTGGFSWHSFADALRGVSWTWLAISWLVGVVSYYVRAVRWEVMLRPLTTAASVWRIFTATIIGFSAVAVFGRAGEPVRPLLIARSEGVSFSSQIAAWILERIFDLLMILIIFGIALVEIDSTALHPGPRLRLVLDASGYTAWIVGAASLLLLIALRQFRGRVRDRVIDGLAFLPARWIERIAAVLRSFEEGMECLRSTWPALLVVAYSVVEWGLVGACFWALFRAFPATENMGAPQVMILLGFVAFGGLVQLPGIGGGMQIAAALVLTEFFGVTLEAASSIALVLWLVTFVGIVPLGFLFAFRQGISWRSLRSVQLET
jgi:uncharacterized protein (TIRG00374 family)